MITPTSFRELIAALGGPAAAAPRLGLMRPNVQAMSERDSIAPEHWPALEAAAASAGLGIDASDFARWRAEKARRRADAEYETTN